MSFLRFTGLLALSLETTTVWKFSLAVRNHLLEVSFPAVLSSCSAAAMNCDRASRSWWLEKRSLL